MKGNKSRQGMVSWFRLALIAALLAVVLGTLNPGLAHAGPNCIQNDTCTPQQLAKLLADDGGQGRQFGWSVSLDGDTALVGDSLSYAPPGMDAKTRGADRKARPAAA